MESPAAVRRGAYLIDGLAVLLHGRLREHGHDLGDAAVADPDLGAVELPGAVALLHGARPAPRTGELSGRRLDRPLR